MTNLEVARRWAAGKSGNGGNMSTNGTTLLSYSTTIGRRHDTGGRTLFLLVPSDGFSMTTKTKHLGPARTASKYESVDVPDVMPTTNEQHRANVAYLLAEAADEDRYAARARTHGETHRTRARRLRHDACRYVCFFAGCPDAATMPWPILADWMREHGWDELADAITTHQLAGAA